MVSLNYIVVLFCFFTYVFFFYIYSFTLLTFLMPATLFKQVETGEVKDWESCGLLKKQG